MLESINKHMRARTAGLAASLALIALGWAGHAGAACMSTDKMWTQASLRPGAAHTVPAVYSPGEDARAQVRGVHDGDEDDEAAIVGLWQFKMSGFSVDWGTQAWHADGTEIMFSGGQNPATGDICQGVWRKVGRNTYTLNHIAMGLTAPGGPFGVRIHFHMVVKLDPSHQSFSGSYKAALYSVGPTDPFDEHVKVVEGSGNVTATRVRPD